MSDALKEVADVMFTEEEVNEYVNPMRDELLASVKKRANMSGGDSVQPDIEEEADGTVLINGVRYKKVG